MNASYKGVSVNRQELRYWRERRILSRRELADSAKVSRTTYYALENGTQQTCRTETIRRLANALSIKPEKLVEVHRFATPTTTLHSSLS